MFGRRYNEGLHQAIEAKEGVTVLRESKTLATITFQNFFRLYEKLSGMTGTALTEEDEFREIYKLDVIEIPTNQSAGPERPARRRLQNRAGQVPRRHPDRSWNAMKKASLCWWAPFPSKNPKMLSRSAEKRGHQAPGAQRQIPRKRSGHRGPGRQTRRRHHRHQHGWSWYRHHAGRQPGMPWPGKIW